MSGSGGQNHVYHHFDHPWDWPEPYSPVFWSSTMHAREDHVRRLEEERNRLEERIRHLEQEIEAERKQIGRQN
jgi:hypothetical protein